MEALTIVEHSTYCYSTDLAPKEICVHHVNQEYTS